MDDFWQTQRIEHADQVRTAYIMYKDTAICKLVHEYSSLSGEEDWVFVPIWENWDPILEKYGELATIAGIDETLRLPEYVRQILPEFVIQRTIPTEREDIGEWITRLKLDYYDRFEAMCRSHGVCGDDRLYVSRSPDKVIDIESGNWSFDIPGEQPHPAFSLQSAGDIPVLLDTYVHLFVEALDGIDKDIAPVVENVLGPHLPRASRDIVDSCIQEVYRKVFSPRLSIFAHAIPQMSRFYVRPLLNGVGGIDVYDSTGTAVFSTSLQLTGSKHYGFIILEIWGFSALGCDIELALARQVLKALDNDLVSLWLISSLSDYCTNLNYSKILSYMTLIQEFNQCRSLLSSRIFSAKDVTKLVQEWGDFQLDNSLTQRSIPIPACAEVLGRATSVLNHLEWECGKYEVSFI